MNQFLNDPLAYQQQVAQQQAMMETPSTPNFFKLPDMVGEPQVSNNMMTTGLMMLASSLKGEDTGSVIANGLQTYAQSVEGDRQRQRQERADRLAEYDLLGRIRERQITELQAVKKTQMLDRLKAKNPEMADLIELDPESAAKVISERFKPKTPFEGTGMDAQIANVLLQGDPSTPEYLAAYNMASQPKVSLGPDGTVVTIRPDMTAYRPPSKGQPVGFPPTNNAQPMNTPPPVNAPNQSGGITISDGTNIGLEKANLSSFAQRMDNADRLINSMGEGADRARTGGVGFAESVLSAIPSMGLTDKIGQGIVKLYATPEQQKYLNAADEWIRAKLRKESGAEIPIEESTAEYSTYFPVAGDTKEVIAQKKALRNNATEGLKKAAGGAYRSIYGGGMLADDTPKDQGVLTQKYKEGQTATMKDGSKVIFTNGQWVKK